MAVSDYFNNGAGPAAEQGETGGAVVLPAVLAVEKEANQSGAGVLGSGQGSAVWPPSI